MPQNAKGPAMCAAAVLHKLQGVKEQTIKQWCRCTCWSAPGQQALDFLCTEVPTAFAPTQQQAAPESNDQPCQHHSMNWTQTSLWVGTTQQYTVLFDILLALLGRVKHPAAWHGTRGQGPMGRPFTQGQTPVQWLHRRGRSPAPSAPAGGTGSWHT